jgi:hypothetical protein
MIVFVHPTLLTHSHTQSLASQALRVQGKEHRSIKSVAHMIVARVFHQQGDFKNAGMQYEQSVGRH